MDFCNSKKPLKILNSLKSDPDLRHLAWKLWGGQT